MRKGWGRLFVLFFIWASVSLAGPRSGYYLGFVKIEGRTDKLGISIEFERRLAKDGTTQLLAFLKLKLGGFYTHEYVSHFYVVNDYRWEAADFVLDGESSGGGTDLTFWQGLILDNGERITGRIRSSHGGIVRGTAELVWIPDPTQFSKLDKIFPELPMVKPITGEYVGQCGPAASLQLEAMKMTDSRNDTLNTLAGFKISGRVGGTPGDPGRMNLTNIQDVTYNIYSGLLNLPYRGLKCKIRGSEITCNDGCQFTRRQEAEQPLDSLLVDYKCRKTKRQHHYEEIAAAPKLKAPYQRELIEGEYYGLLHLEERDVYKGVSFEVALGGPPTAFQPGSWQAEVSSVLRIFTTQANGLNLETDNYMSVPFQPSIFPDGEFKTLFLDSRSDLILKITHWSEKGIIADLFSKSYGHAGTLELIRGRVPPEFEGTNLPCASPLEGDFFGRLPMPKYPHAEMSFSLALSPINSMLTPSPSYFPFRFAGRVEIYLSARPVYGLVASGVFDIFTGVIRLQLDAQQILLGRVGSHGIRAGVLGGSDRSPLLAHRWIDFKWMDLRPLKDQ